MRNVCELYISRNEIATLKVRIGHIPVQEIPFALGWKSDDMFRKGEIRLTDIGRLLGSDWPALAAELELTEDEVTKLMDEFGENASLHMLRYWLKSRGSDATGADSLRTKDAGIFLPFRKLPSTSLTKNWKGEYRA